MKNNVILLIGLLLVFFSSNGQSIEMDKQGQLLKMKKVKKLAVNDKIDLSLAFPAYFRDNAIKKQQQLLKDKIDSVIIHYEDFTNSAFDDFFEAIWGDSVSQEMILEFKSIKTFLEDGTAPARIFYLAQFFTELRAFLATPLGDWYSFNNSAIVNSQYTLRAGDLSANDNAFVLEVRVNLLFNKLITDLFNRSYAAADMNRIRAMTPANYVLETKILQELAARTNILSKYDANKLNDSAINAMTALRKTFDSLELVKAIKSASYFKNWLWYRGGELTLNPFEKRFRDLSTDASASLFPASKNTLMLDSLTLKENNLHRFLFPVQQKDHRVVYFFQREKAFPDDVNDIRSPLKSTEEVQVVVYNVAARDSVGLRLVKSEAHNGLNATLSAIDSALSVLGAGYAAANVAAGGWKLLAAQLGVIFKSTGSEISADLVQVNAIAKAPFTDAAVFWTAFETDLKNLGKLNPHLLDIMKRNASLQTILTAAMATKDLGRIKGAIKTITVRYANVYQYYMFRVKSTQKDSIAISNIYRMAFESNLPPKAVSLHADNGPFGFRTEILNTGTVEGNFTQTYSIKRFRKTGTATDSTQIGSFTYKSSPKQIFAASIGPAFTLPGTFYAKNKVTETPNEPIKIETTRPVVNFTFGLHIYPFKIFTLDNHLFHSKASPFYERLSFYAGLAFPQTLDNFYPGISFDVVAGIRVIGGVHCYIHDRYKIVNNVVEDKSSRFRAAGAFFSLNIDPKVAAKAIGIIK